MEAAAEVFSGGCCGLDGTGDGSNIRKIISEEIKDTIFMHDILQHYSLPKLNRTGFISYPFHAGDRESWMKIYSRDYHCFACAANGDIFFSCKNKKVFLSREAFLALGGTYPNGKQESRFGKQRRMMGKTIKSFLYVACTRALHRLSLFGEGKASQLIHIPEDYDDIFHYVIDLNTLLRDWPYDMECGKIYVGMGIFLLTDTPPDFYTAQYNADICRTECPESGLIGELDLYMFEKVCKTVNRWIEQADKKFRISVNLSSNMFNYRYFFNEYKPVYEKNPCPKECIEFELLESIVLNQVDLVRDVVEQLREYGFSCSLDDFGNGQGSAHEGGRRRGGDKGLRGFPQRAWMLFCTGLFLL